MNKQLTAILIIIILGHQAAFAQRKGRAAARDTMRTNTIEVVQSYRPEIQQAQKPELAPDLPPADTSAGRMQYDVPVQTLNFTYRSQPLKPLALLGRDTGALPFANYLKLGGGNLSTLYIDAGIGSLQGENYETAIHLHHLSQKGIIKFQESMLTGVEATGTLRTAGHAWHAGISGLRNSHYQYGYDHAAMPGFTPPQQVLTGVRLQAGAENESENASGIRYQPQISASYFGGSRIDGEQQITVSAPFSKDIDSSIRVHIDLSGSYTALQVAGIGNSAGMFALNTGISFQRDFFKGHVYLAPTVGYNNSYLLPDIMASAQIRQFTVKGGWKALLHQNSYERFFLRNPFVTPSLFSPLLLQNRTDEVYGDAQTNIGNNIMVAGRVSWWQFRNMPLFINNPIDRKQFDIITDPTINAVSLQANVRYQVARIFALGLSGSWFNYYNSTFTHVWHEPGIQLKADFQFSPMPNLTITGYLMALDQIYATDITGRAIKLKAIMDLGCGAEYTIIPRLSAFLNINNLLNNSYQRWHYYPAYGFNIYGGLRLKF